MLEVFGWTVLALFMLLILAALYAAAHATFKALGPVAIFPVAIFLFVLVVMPEQSEDWDGGGYGYGMTILYLLAFLFMFFEKHAKYRARAKQRKKPMPKFSLRKAWCRFRKRNMHLAAYFCFVALTLPLIFRDFFGEWGANWNFSATFAVFFVSGLVLIHIRTKRLTREELWESWIGLQIPGFLLISWILFALFVLPQVFRYLWGWEIFWGYWISVAVLVLSGFLWNSRPVLYIAYGLFKYEESICRKEDPPDNPTDEP